MFIAMTSKKTARKIRVTINNLFIGIEYILSRIIK